MRWYQTLGWRFFGWHYAMIDFSYDKKIVRVKALPNGQLYARYCGGLVIEGERGWRPLTWRETPKMRAVA